MTGPSSRSASGEHERAIAVCICTSGRAAALERCLASIRGGSAEPAAIHVSDDSHSSAVARLCERYGAIYREGPARGLCANRNAVVADVRTSHVALIDDDGVFGTDFIRDATALLPSLGPSEIVSGTIVERSGPAHPARSSYLGFFTGTQPPRATNFHLNANVVPRCAFARAMFDERIEYGYEDLDFTGRLIMQGFTIRHVPELENRHLPPDDPALQRSRVRQERRARFLVALKLRAYRHAWAAPSQTLFAAIATAHALAHSARSGSSLLAPMQDMAWAWRLARQAQPS